MRIRILDPHWKKMDPGNLLIFFNKAKLSIFLSYLFRIFMLKLDEPFRNQEIFIISFFKSSDLGFGVKMFF